MIKLRLFPVLLILFLVGCETPTSTPPTSPPPESSQQNLLPTVVSTTGGDTVTLNVDGQSATVQLACIAIPATVEPQAAARLQELLPSGQAVQSRVIEPEPEGETSAELFLGNQPVGVLLVSEGLAQIDPQQIDDCADTRGGYLEAENEAQQQRRGIWGQAG